MRYLSVCSGIEAASVGWHGLGWTPVAVSEIEPFPCSVLTHHYPSVPNWGDMTAFQEWPDESIDLLVGGTPCQSFSVAGLRQGLADPRGNLMLTFLAIAQRYRPKWVVWENVPGVLSSNAGRDFGSFLGGLAELGYGWAYRVLDAQYFGVAQRRRRVFVVGCLGNWAAAAAVLFERESLSGHPAPSREARQDVANSLVERPDRGGGNSEGQRLIPVLHEETVGSLCADSHPGAYSGQDAYTGRLVAQPVSFGIPGNWIGRAPKNGGNAVEPMHDVAPCLTKADRHGVAQPISFPWQQGATQHGGVHQDHTMPLTKNQTLAVAQSMQVRRLTPRECERLQGFPDDYTLIPHRGRPAADGPRYKALGNSMAVPCMKWIGERIDSVHTRQHA